MYIDEKPLWIEKKNSENDSRCYGNRMKKKWKSEKRMSKKDGKINKMLNQMK